MATDTYKGHKHQIFVVQDGPFLLHKCEAKACTYERAFDVIKGG